MWPLKVGVVFLLIGLPASSAWGASFSPGRFVVRGKPLLSAGRVSAGHSVSVFAKPVAVTVDGCATAKPSVRLKRGVATLSGVLTCKGIRGSARLAATIRGATMRGRVTVRKRQRVFVARLAGLRGRLLRGRPRASALPALGSGDAITRHPASEVSVSHGVQVLRTELLLTLSRGATIGQVNAALTLVGGRIVGSFAHSPLITVGIPDPGSLATLDALRRLLVRRPGVAGTARSVLTKAADLPQGFSAPPLGDPGDLALHHLLALRMPAAWNARTALDVSRRPLLLIEDVFGNGLPDPHVDARLENPSAFLTGAPDAAAHGYHVLGIAAADHNSDGSPAGLVTGVFPATTDLDVVDMAGGLSDSDTLNLLRDEVLARSKVDPHIVVNTSLAFGSGFPLVRAFGSQWLSFIRDNSLEDDVLQATAAGNDSVTTSPTSSIRVSAWDTSAWTAAALVPGIKDANGQRTSNLLNTLVVESVSDGGAPAFDPGCRSGYSDVGGTVAAFGDGVYSNLLGSDAGTLSGTSMATPEIAALAEYLWSIAPELTARQIIHAIEFNFSPPLACQDQPAADAYAATLSLDHPGQLTPAGSPVRFAILDQNHDGRFDEADVSAFADHIFKTPAPSDRDWSRYDLNGDGFTGGDTRAPFDLDTAGSTRTDAPTLSTVTQTVHDTNGNPLQVQLDEHKATDADVLCYYAYSSLYTVAAQDDQRDKILGDHCAPPISIVSCGFDGDTASSATVGGTPDPQSHHVELSGCGSFTTPESMSRASSSTDSATATANSSASASGSAGTNGGTLLVSAHAEGSGTVTSTNPSPTGGSNASADAGPSIAVKVNRTCTFTLTGNVTASAQGTQAHVAFDGFQITPGSSAGTSGTLQPGTYALSAVASTTWSISIVGNFDAPADASGTVTLTC